MNNTLAAALPSLLPLAIEWAKKCAADIAATGQPLNERGLALAKSVDVAQPERIRTKIVKELPLPENRELREAAIMAGLLGEGMIGITFGYGIYICEGHETTRVHSHEFRHVYQYEQEGSIANFLSIYLPQIVEHTYNAAPLELDAIAHEIPD